MLITHEEMKQREIPFWDDAVSEGLAGVPCWPYDAEGYASDCPDESILVGVLGADGVLRAEEAAPFKPFWTHWECADCAQCAARRPAPEAK